MFYPLLVLIFTEAKRAIEYQKISKIFSYVFVLAMVIVCLQNIMFSNREHTYQKITYDRTGSLTT